MVVCQPRSQGLSSFPRYLGEGPLERGCFAVYFIPFRYIAMKVYSCQLNGKFASHIDIRFLILRTEMVTEVFAMKKDVSVVENEVHWNIDTLGSELAAHA